jgi:hypothetical protein
MAAQHCPVAGGLPQRGELLPEICLVDLPQHVFSEEGGHRLHFGGDCGVLRCEIRVICAGVHNAKGVTCRLKVAGRSAGLRARSDFQNPRR